MKLKLFILCIFSLGLFLPASLVFGETPAKPWKANAELSFVNSNGNTKATSISAKSKYNYDWSKVGLELEAGTFGTRSQQVATAEQYFASEKMTWKFSEKNFAFEKVRWDKDRFAGLKNRYDLAAGLGRQLLDLPKDKLTGELGGGYIFEERTGSLKNNFGSGRAYTKYVRILSDTANFSQDIEYLANFKDNQDYRLNTETALIASLSTYLSMKASFIWKKVNKPPVGFYQNDTYTTVSLIFNY